MSNVGARAALGRAGRLFGIVAGSPSIDPSIGTGSPSWPAAPDNDDDHGFPELDCVRRSLPARVIAAAELRAARLAVGADRVLIASGALDEETYLRALGERIGVSFEPLDDMPRGQCPLDDGRLIEAAALGLLPIEAGGGIAYVVAPRGVAARKILAMVADTPDAAAGFRFTTAERFSRFVRRGAGMRLAANASEALKQKWPALSAASPYRLGNAVTLTPILLAIAAGLYFAPAITVHAFDVLLAAIFIAWLALRITGAFVRRPPKPAIPAGRDHALPVYTIICALYQEASSVNGLLSSFERLDYPALGSKCTNGKLAIAR